MKKKILLIPLALLLVISLIAIGCPAPAEKTEIKIGVTGAYTGFAASMGLSHKKGFDLRMEQIGYEIAGRPVKVTYEDCVEDVATTVTKVKKLVEQDQVHVLNGPLLGSGIQAIKDYMKEKGIPWCPLGVAYEDILLDNPAHFAPTQGAFQYASPVPIYAYNKLGVRTAVIIVSDFAYGNDVGGLWQSIFTKLGGKVVKYIALPLTEQDYRPYLVGMPKADAAFVFTSGMCSVYFVKQYAELNLQQETPVLALTSTLDPLFRKDMGRAALGMRYIAVWDPTLDVPKNVAFVKDMEAKYPGEPVDYYAMAGFMFVQIIEEALQSINGNAEDSAAFVKAIKGVDFDGLFGRFKYIPEYNAPVVDMYVFEIVEQDGSFPTKLVDTMPQLPPYLP